MHSVPLFEVHGEVCDQKIWHSGSLVFYKTPSGAEYILEMVLEANKQLPYLSKKFSPDQLKKCPHKNVKFRSAVFVSLVDGTSIKFKSQSQTMCDLVSFLNKIKESNYEGSFQKTENVGRGLPYTRTYSSQQLSPSPRRTYSPRYSPVIKSPSGHRLPRNSPKLREMKDSEDFVLEIVDSGRKSTGLSPQGFFGSSGSSSSNYSTGRTPLRMLNSNTPNQENSKRLRQINLDMSKRPKLSCDVVEKDEDDDQQLENSTQEIADGQDDKEAIDSTVEVFPYNGFPNIGNSCFMNSVLQSLLQLRCISDNLDQTCKILENALPEQSIIRYLLSLLSCPPGDCQQILGQTLEVVCHSSPCFADGQQHDALEFLIQLLDVIKEEVKKCSSVGSLSHCPVTDNIEFQLGSSYICEKCQRTISRKEVLHMLSLNVLNAESEAFSSLSDALRDYFEPQQIEMTCERCSASSVKCIQGFSTLPRVLIFHLKRYTYSHGTCKIMCPIQVPVCLSVEEFLIDKAVSSPQSLSATPVTPPNTLAKEADQQLPDLDLDSSSPHHRSECESDVLDSPEHEENIPKSNSIQAQQCSIPERIVLNDRHRSSPIALKGGSDSASDSSAIPTGSEVPCEKSEMDTIDTVLEDTEEEQLDRVLKMSAESTEGQEDRELVEAMNRSIQDANSSILEDCEAFQEDFSQDDSKDDFENFSGPFSYRLASVVSHIGQNADTGHYVSNYFDSQSGQWWHFNDRIVQKRSKHTVLESIKTRGYLFFYVACDSNV